MKKYETKIQKQFIDTGFGIPVVFKNVPMIKLEGVWTPQVNYKKLAVWLATQISDKKTLLSGNEVRFVRQFFEMTLEEFAALFDVSHPTVIKWERKGDNPTDMAWTTEKDIRLYIYSRLKIKTGAFLERYKELTADHNKIGVARSAKLGPVTAKQIERSELVLA